MPGGEKLTVKPCGYSAARSKVDLDCVLLHNSKIMERQRILDQGNAMNPLAEKPSRVQLGTIIAARFVDVGLDEPLSEMHWEIDRLPLAIPTHHQEDAQD